MFSVEIVRGIKTDGANDLRDMNGLFSAIKVMALLASITSPFRTVQIGRLVLLKPLKGTTT